MRQRLLIFVIILPAFYKTYAQTQADDEPIFVKRATKTFDLKKYVDIVIVQNVVRRGNDSIRLVIDGDSLLRKGNFLFVRPVVVAEDRFINDDKPSNMRTYYGGAEQSTTLLKIPINEIEKINSKRQPYCLLMSSLTAASLIGAFGSLAIPPESTQQIKLRTNILVPCLASAVVSFATRLAWGEKRMYFDKKRTHKAVWSFE